MSNIIDCLTHSEAILMEGALGERLKREYHLSFDAEIAMAGLIYSERGRAALEALWKEYAEIAHAYHLPFLATTPTRRTNRERVARSRYDDTVIRDNVEFLRSVQAKQKVEMFVGGLAGCRGDAYTGFDCLPFEEARAFHAWETERFAQAGVDFIYAALMPTLDEAAGMAVAQEAFRIPYIISFTIQRNGCLIDGTSISSAISRIDEMTEHKPLCYMTNCVHPRIVAEALSQSFNRTELVKTRFLGLQANTSDLPYDELDRAALLHTSSPAALADAMMEVREIQPLRIFGGCCGTDGRHLREIAKRLSSGTKHT